MESDAAERDELLARYGIKPSIELHVSTVPGIWSVILAAVASPVGDVIMLYMTAFATAPLGGMGDPDVQNAFDVASWVRGGMVVASVVGAITLGVISIARASRGRELPGSRAALTLGVIGILLATLSGAYYASVMSYLL